MKKRFNLWLPVGDLIKLKKMAKGERRSVNSYVLSKLFNDKEKKEVKDD